MISMVPPCHDRPSHPHRHCASLPRSATRTHCGRCPWSEPSPGVPWCGRAVVTYVDLSDLYRHLYHILYNMYIIYVQYIYIYTILYDCMYLFSHFIYRCMYLFMIVYVLLFIIIHLCVLLCAILYVLIGFYRDGISQDA